jgi:polygalacturonase
MTKRHFLVFLSAFAFILGSCTEQINKSTSRFYEDIEFEMALVNEPLIPSNSVNIKDFGAINGGLFDNSKAFKDAIDAVTEKGGGKVIIPAGIWLTGPIILKSKLELHAESGALIRFSTNKDLYPIIETSFEGLNTWRCISPIYGKDLEDVAFTGKGVWDGSGEAWRSVKKGKLTESAWKKLVASGGVLNDKKDLWSPSE